MNYCSCKGQKLTLTCGEVITSLAHDLIKSVFELVYKRVRIDVLARLIDLLVANILKAKKYIASDSTREKEDILKLLNME